jgi:hypothetical protein
VQRLNGCRRRGIGTRLKITLVAAITERLLNPSDLSTWLLEPAPGDA